MYNFRNKKYDFCPYRNIRYFKINNQETFIIILYYISFEGALYAPCCLFLSLR